MEIKIEELSKKYLDQAIRLIHQIFITNPHDQDSPDIWFPASLNPNTEDNKKHYEKLGVVKVKYFLALDGEKVIGTTGFYTLKKDVNEAYWLGWFSVHPRYRRIGIGMRLYKLIEEKAKKAGKEFIRLYTTDSKEEKNAQKFYDKIGLKIYKTEESTYSRREKILYREKKIE